MEDSGLLPGLLGYIFESHSWFELLSIYVALGIPYLFVAKNGEFKSFMISIYQSKTNSTLGAKLGAPLFLAIAFLFVSVVSFMVSLVQCYFFSQLHEYLPNVTANFEFKKMVFECAVAYLFSYLAMQVGSVNS